MKIVIIPGLTLPSVSCEDLAEIDRISNGAIVQVVEYEEAQSALVDADVVLGLVQPQLFQYCQNLKWVQAIASGVDSMLTPEFIASAVVLTSEKGLVGEHLADHAMGLLLMLSRQLKTSLLHGVDAWSHRSQMRQDMFELNKQRMGLFGFGGTGRATARRAHGFGMEVVALDCDPVPPEFPVTEVWSNDRFDELVETSDVLAICVPLTQETRGVCDSTVFKRMKSTAILLNVTRGEVMIESDLIEALEQGEIAGAALDVVPKEPISPENPLWQMPNVVMTPHCAGASQYRAQRNMQRFLTNLEKYANGENLNALEGLIDKRRGF